MACTYRFWWEMKPEHNEICFPQNQETPGPWRAEVKEFILSNEARGFYAVNQTDEFLKYRFTDNRTAVAFKMKFYP